MWDQETLSRDTNYRQIPADYGKKIYLQGVCSKWNELFEKLLSGGIQAEPYLPPLRGVMGHFY